MLDTPPLSSPQRNWVAPPLDYFKVNVDGASSIDGSGISGIGVIVKDEMGRVISALCKALPVHYPTKITKFFCFGTRGTFGSRDEYLKGDFRIRCFLCHFPLFLKPVMVAFCVIWCKAFNLRNRLSPAVRSVT